MQKDPSPRPPSPEGIAAFVKLQRGLFGWKQDTLAALAGISLSTIRRVERGEAVRPAQLRKLAVALKCPEDAFTREIVPLSFEEAADALLRQWSWIDEKVPVKVAPLTKELQLRELLETDYIVVDCDMGEEAAEAVAELREWLDLGSFIRGGQSGLFRVQPSCPKVSLRAFYRTLLDNVRRVEAERRAVCLAGTYEATVNGGPISSLKVAVLALRSRDNNPAAAKIGTLYANPTIDLWEAIRAFREQEL